MVRVVGLVALLVPVLGGRVEKVHSDFHTQARTTVNRGLELLEALKENPDDVNLQNEYGELIGDVDWHESRVLLETGAQVQQAPVSLGAQSAAGQSLMMVERTGFVESLGRFLTNRRDYAFEQEGGHTKYVMDGRTLSLHSRMFVSIVGEENPRFIVRRAFNYLNPISSSFGQFVYRVIQCTDAYEGECSEGDILYTITKDRLGRGALWGMDEYRVYTGTGGCGRWGHGIVSCDQHTQLYYSLGAGLSEATFDTDFYKGNIIAIDGDRQSATVASGSTEVEMGSSELASMKVARTTKVEGPPRWLNWIAPVMPMFGVGLEFARAAIWSDTYRLSFEGAADELLVSLMAACQDLTRDMINTRAVARSMNAANQAAAASAVAASSPVVPATR